MPRTLAQNAQYIAETIKPAIKSAIEAQGVTVPSTDSFLDYADRIAEIEGGGSGYQLKDLPSGAISTVTDAAPLPLNALKVSVEAVQDLHGYDHPWPGGAGKNKLPLVLADIKAANINGTWSGDTYTVNGVSFEVDSDDDGNIISIKGVRGSGSSSGAISIPFELEAGYYVMSSGFTEIVYTNDTFIAKDNVVIARGNSNSPGTSFVLSETSNVIWTFRITTKSETCYPMIRLATESDSTFTPYSNICSLSGWDSGEITVCDDIQNPTQTETYTLDFPSAIYGAEWDVVHGSVNNTYGVVVIDGSTNVVSNGAVSGNVYQCEWQGARSIGAPLSGYMSDRFQTVENADKTDWSIYPSTVSTATRMFFGFPKDTFASSSDCNAWFAEHPTQVVFKLATPTTIQLSPLSIRLLESTNNLYADCGEIIEGEYFIGSSGAYDLYDYIQTDGTQLIDTGRAITAGDEVKTIFTAISGGSNGAYVWGKYVDPYYTALVIYPSNGFYRHYDYTRVGDNPVDQTNFTVGKITEDSYTIATTLGGNYTLFDTASVKLYAFNINGDDYLPCKRRSDGKFGLYDVKNSTFLTDSASGNAITGGNNLGVRIG